MNVREKITIKSPDRKGVVTASKVRTVEPSPSTDSPIGQILHLQRIIGNRAVQRLLKSGVIQAKLNIEQAGDIYEQKVAQVSKKLMHLSEQLFQRQREKKNKYGIKKLSPVEERIQHRRPKSTSPKSLSNYIQIQKNGCSPRRRRKRTRQKVPLAVYMARRRCSNLDEAIRLWAIYRFVFDLDSPTITKRKYWSRLSKHNFAGIDIYVKEPGKSESRYTVIVRIKGPNIVEASLFVWFKYSSAYGLVFFKPVKIRRFLGTITTYRGGCLIVDKPLPKPPRRKPRPRPSPPGATGLA